MIATRFLDLIVGNDRFQSVFGSLDYNSMIATQYDDQNFQLDHDFEVDQLTRWPIVGNSGGKWKTIRDLGGNASLHT